jgi:hypothetical protein
MIGKSITTFVAPPQISRSVHLLELERCHRAEYLVPTVPAPVGGEVRRAYAAGHYTKASRRIIHDL